jgi:hypothetical protein
MLFSEIRAAGWLPVTIYLLRSSIPTAKHTAARLRQCRRAIAVLFLKIWGVSFNEAKKEAPLPGGDTPQCRPLLWLTPGASA